MSKARGEPNPLHMRQAEPAGPFFLPPQECTIRRRDWLQRTNRILTTYADLLALASEGYRSYTRAVKEARIQPKTRVRIRIDGKSFHSSYKLLLAAFPLSAGQLANQVFTLIYGNLEAYLADILSDALELEGSDDPLQDAISLVTGTRWEGKFSRISNRLHIPLGKADLTALYKDITIEFFGIQSTDPVAFVQAIADLRHRIVHSAGRADAKFLAAYPQADFRVGDLIEIPPASPFDLQFAFLPLTEHFDRVLSAKYGWKRTLEDPAKLVDPLLLTA